MTRTAAPWSTAARSASGRRPSSRTRPSGSPSPRAIASGSIPPHPAWPTTISGGSSMPAAPWRPAAHPGPSAARAWPGSAGIPVGHAQAGAPRGGIGGCGEPPATPAPVTTTRAGSGRSRASSSATACVGTTTASAVRATRSAMRRCQRTPRGVSVSGWVQGTASWMVTTSGRSPRGGASRVGACTRSPPRGRTGTPRSQAATRDRARRASRRAPALPPRGQPWCPGATPSRPAPISGRGGCGERGPHLGGVPARSPGHRRQELLDDQVHPHPPTLGGGCAGVRRRELPSGACRRPTPWSGRPPT